MNMTVINDVLKKYDFPKESIISIFREIQSKFNYIPKEALFYISSELGVPITSLYHIASFFKSFSLEPRGKHQIHVCMGTACHVRGAVSIKESLERELDIKAGETTNDFNFTLETVNCLGACALAPLVVVDKEYNSKMTISKAEKLINKYKEEEKASRTDKIDGFIFIPEYCYTKNHLWFKQVRNDCAYIGIDDLAGKILGKINQVKILQSISGNIVKKGKPIFNLFLEGYKLKVRTPIDIILTEINEKILKDPSLINKDPYEKSWLFKIKNFHKEEEQLISEIKAKEWFKCEVDKLYGFFSDKVGATAMDGGEICEKVLDKLTKKERKKLIKQLLYK